MLAAVIKICYSHLLRCTHVSHVHNAGRAVRSSSSQDNMNAARSTCTRRLLKHVSRSHIPVIASSRSSSKRLHSTFLTPAAFRPAQHFDSAPFIPVFLSSSIHSSKRESSARRGKSRRHQFIPIVFQALPRLRPHIRPRSTPQRPKHSHALRRELKSSKRVTWRERRPSIGGPLT